MTEIITITTPATAPSATPVFNNESEKEKKDLLILKEINMNDLLKYDEAVTKRVFLNSEIKSVEPAMVVTTNDDKQHLVIGMSPFGINAMLASLHEGYQGEVIDTARPHTPNGPKRSYTSPIVLHTFDPNALIYKGKIERCKNFWKISLYTTVDPYLIECVLLAAALQLRGTEFSLTPTEPSNLNSNVA